MKLRNKKTGEIKAFDEVMREAYKWDNYDSLAELNEEWEDYEEPKKLGHWYYDTACNRVDFIENCNATNEDKKLDKQIGNYFETKEEAEKAVEKLEAWKRLKDKGFRFKGWTIDDGLKISICTNFDSDGIYDDDKKEIKSNLDICFGGEE